MRWETDYYTELKIYWSIKARGVARAGGATGGKCMKYVLCGIKQLRLFSTCTLYELCSQSRLAVGLTLALILCTQQCDKLFN